MSTLNRDIQQLNLASNNITSLKRNEFYGKKFGNLQKINLNNNKLSQIDSRAFYKLTGLVELDLSENSISRFDDQVIDDSISERLELSFAQLDNDESELISKESAQEIGLPIVNRLQHRTKATIDGRNSLNLSSTFLQDLPQLRVLNLASNDLIALAKFTFSPLTQLRQLYLSK